MEFNEHQIQPKEAENPEKKGKRVCAYCGKELGEFAGGENTHTICPECKAKREKNDQTLIKDIQQKHEVVVEKVEGWKKEFAQERINIIENPIFTREDKIQKLKNDGFIQGQLRISLTGATTPAELEEVCQKLREIFNIKE